MSRDSRCTVAIVIGSCIGESITPVVVGRLMAIYGPDTFPAFISIATVALVSAYVFLHLYLKNNLKSIVVEDPPLNRMRSATIDDAAEGAEQAVVDLVQQMMPFTQAVHPAASGAMTPSRARKSSLTRRSSKTAMMPTNYGSTEE